MSKEKITHRKKRRIPLSVYLSYLLIVTLVATGVTFSAYVTRISGADSARVAKFLVTVDSVQQETIKFLDLIPGDVRQWEFDVDFDSEVAAQCKIMLSSTQNLPLTYTLTHGDSTQNVELGEWMDVYEVVAGGHNETQEFVLTVTWPANENATELMGMADAVTLYIKTEQID